MKNVQSHRFGADTLWSGVHESGLRVFVYAKPRFSSACALLGTAYGSIDTRFRRAGETHFAQTPAGIAHFLEHKLFESAGEDAFARFARTGASANAYTSFDRTCYLFSCAGHFAESLEILLDFVQQPYFTPETVQKEQGIIAQEIRMGDDDPDQLVFRNLLRCLYHEHPVRDDVAGTVESIAQIDAPLLHCCYRTFYHPSNMVLSVAGRVDPNEVFAMAERMVPPNRALPVERQFPAEPESVAQTGMEARAAVAAPMFELGFKEPAPARKTAKQCAETAVLLQMLASDTSPLYRRLRAAGLVNETFGADYLEGPGYAAVVFGGESADPARAADEIQREIARLRRDGIPAEDFECARRALYGSAIAGLGSVGYLAGALADCAFAGRAFGDEPAQLRAMTAAAVGRRLAEQMQPDRAAISIVRPME